MRTYLAILRGALMGEMAYRMSFFFGLLGNLLYMCVAYFLWTSIYQNTTTIHGLTFNDTYIYVGLGSTIFVLLKTFADWQIANEISDGSISKSAEEAPICQELGSTAEESILKVIPPTLSKQRR